MIWTLYLSYRRLLLPYYDSIFLWIFICQIVIFALYLYRILTENKRALDHTNITCSVIGLAGAAYLTSKRERQKWCLNASGEDPQLRTSWLINTKTGINTCICQTSILSLDIHHSSRNNSSNILDNFQCLWAITFFYPIIVFYLPEDAIVGFILSSTTAGILGMCMCLSIQET
jgi:hypothetical protein